MSKCSNNFDQYILTKKFDFDQNILTNILKNLC